MSLPSLPDTLKNIESTISLEALEEIRLMWLGKKGLFTEEMKNLSTLSVEEKKERGAWLNKQKTELEQALIQRKKQLEEVALEMSLSQEWQDITLPSRGQKEGRIHPLTQLQEEILSYLLKQGFSLEEGPEIEDEEKNFSALNIPSHHPARQMQDTFYLESQEGQDANTPNLLRTHTSNVQIWTMRQKKPPYRFLSMGRVYRSDYDMTHTPMFHQLEVVVIDQCVTMAHLKGFLINFLRHIFVAPHLELRFRPSYFPFTEPSVEIDCNYTRKEDGSLILGEGDQWMELLGAGMIHPNVLKNCEVDPATWQGFAIGMGLERVAMLKYGIGDLRTFFQSDVRWLHHYGFPSLSTPSLFREAVL